MKILIGCALLAAALFGQETPSKWDSLPLNAIQVKNRVSKCLVLTPQKVVRNGSVVKLVASGEFLQSTAECACKSALLTYRVYEQRTATNRDDYVTAVVSTMSSKKGAKREFEFVLTSDAAISYGKGIRLDIGCDPAH